MDERGLHKKRSGWYNNDLGFSKYITQARWTKKTFTTAFSELLPIDNFHRSVQMIYSAYRRSIDPEKRKNQMKKSNIFKGLILAIISMSIACGQQTATGDEFSQLNIPTSVSALDTPTILILIDLDVNEGLDAKLDRFEEDLQNEGWSPIRVSGNYTTPQQIRFLINLVYDTVTELAGVFLIGEIPFALVDNPWSDQSSGAGATDYYYMDLDGQWLDTNDDGVFDFHGPGDGDREPEVFVGRLDGSRNNVLNEELGMTELDMYRDYFDRNHAYRTGIRAYDDRSLFVASENFPNEGSYMTAVNAQRNLYYETLGLAWERTSDGHTVSNGTGWEWSFDLHGDDGYDDQGNFLGQIGIARKMVNKRMGQNLHFVHLESHGWVEGWERLLNSNDIVSIVDQDGKLPGFVSGHACHAGNLVESNSVANTIVLSGGLGIIANTTFGIYLAEWDAEFTTAFATGTIGEAVEAMHIRAFTPVTNDTSTLRGSHTLILLGDPTLRHSYEAPGRAEENLIRNSSYVKYSLTTNMPDYWDKNWNNQIPPSSFVLESYDGRNGVLNLSCHRNGLGVKQVYDPPIVIKSDMVLSIIFKIESANLDGDGWYPESPEAPVILAATFTKPGASNIVFKRFYNYTQDDDSMANVNFELVLQNTWIQKSYRIDDINLLDGYSLSTIQVLSSGWQRRAFVDGVSLRYGSLIENGSFVDYYPTTNMPDYWDKNWNNQSPPSSFVLGSYEGRNGVLDLSYHRNGLGVKQVYNSPIGIKNDALLSIIFKIESADLDGDGWYPESPEAPVILAATFTKPDASNIVFKRFYNYTQDDDSMANVNFELVPQNKWVHKSYSTDDMSLPDGYFLSTIQVLSSGWQRRALVDYVGVY